MPKLPTAWTVPNSDCLSCESIFVETLVTTEPIPINSTTQQITAQVRVTNNSCVPYDTTDNGSTSDTPNGFNFGLGDEFESIGVLDPGETGTSSGVTDDINLCDTGNVTDWALPYWALRDVEDDSVERCPPVSITVACDI